MSRTSAARAQFVTDLTCPNDRVTVVHTPADTPPPDVAADPPRLALWNQQASASDLYLVQGCGQSRRYDCRVQNGPWPYHYDCTPR